jgi:2-deoxy-D-gluconate 3-dehydrogenase
MTNPFGLEGKGALVTGANTGLGQAIAVGLAQAGADIVAAGRSSAAETGDRVAAAGRRFFEVRADLGSIKPIAQLVEVSVEKLGRVDILVNNAGVARRGRALEFTEEDWDQVMDLNLKSAFFLSQSVARRMLADGKGGKIINIASMMSFQGGIGIASYTASKSGIAGITRLLANEWASRGINVNAIAPGYFATNITESLRKDDKRRQEILDRIPAGRWGAPDDLAGAAVFLASGASDYVHGSLLVVDGGWLAR